MLSPVSSTGSYGKPVDDRPTLAASAPGAVSTSSVSELGFPAAASRFLLLFLCIFEIAFAARRHAFNYCSL